MWYTQILNDVWRANPKDVWKSTVLKETQQSPGGCLFDGLHCMMNFQRNRQDGYLMIIIFHTSPQKHVLWVLIRIASPSDSNEYLGEAILMSTHNTFLRRTQGDSNEYPQHMFLWRTLENYSLIIIKYSNFPKFSDRQVWANSADPRQTAPRGESDQGLHCLQFPLHLLDALLETLSCSTFMVITMKFLVSEIFSDFCAKQCQKAATYSFPLHLRGSSCKIWL